MEDAPTFEDALDQTLSGLDTEDVRIFYDYFEDLKRRARGWLDRRAQVLPGESAAVQSALLSLFRDLQGRDIPLYAVDEDGNPILWPEVLKYVERHCGKWKGYYRSKKHNAHLVSLGAGPDGPGLDVADYRAGEEDEKAFAAVCEALRAKLSVEDQVILDAKLQGKALAETARLINRSESHVSNRLKRIREVLKTL